MAFAWRWRINVRDVVTCEYDAGRQPQLRSRDSPSPPSRQGQLTSHRDRDLAGMCDDPFLNPFISSASCCDLWRAEIGLINPHAMKHHVCGVRVDLIFIRNTITSTRIRTRSPPRGATGRPSGERTPWTRRCIWNVGSGVELSLYGSSRQRARQATSLKPAAAK
jgi:hypothetical protein